MSKSNENPRQGLFKANTLNIEDSRLRRHEVSVEIRKLNREKQLLKRRNIIFNDDEMKDQPPKFVNGQSPDEIVAAMRSDNADRQFLGMQLARKMLSRDEHPPIDMLIGQGIVPLCVQFLQDTRNEMLQFEAAWALTNIASGNTEQTRVVIDHNAVPLFVELIRSSAMNLAEQAVWALGNIAGDSAEARDIVLQHNVVEGILPLVKPDIPISFLRNIVWLMSNLCRNKNSSPPLEQVQLLLPALSDMLLSNDYSVLTDACWALSYVTDDNYNKIQAVIDVGAVPRLVKLLEINDTGLVMPALRSIGNIVLGTDEQTDTVIEAGVLPMLGILMKHNRMNIVKEAAWTVSNITAGNPTQIQAVIDSGIFHQIREVLERGDSKAQNEAAWAVTNTTNSVVHKQVIGLVETFGILKPFIDILDAKDPCTILVVQTGLHNLLALADKLGVIDKLSLMVEEMGGLDKLEALQHHENKEVYKKACDIIDTFFSSDNDETEREMAPADGDSEFQATQPQAPEGGFSF